MAGGGAISSLGTVMTHPDYRNRGLSRWLMERVLKEWGERGHALYLYANDGVRSFYPGLDFKRRKSSNIPAKSGRVPARSGG